MIDGSTDGSIEMLSRKKWRSLSVRILAHPVRRGKGVAVREGVLAARGRVIAFIDADRAIDPAAVAKGLALMRQDPSLDGIVGRRRQYRTTLVRHFAHLLFHWGTYLLFRMPFHDTQAPLKMFRAPVAKKIFGRMQTKSYAFDIEVLFRTRTHGYRIAELDVAQRSTPSALKWSMVPFTFLELLRIYRTYIAHRTIRLLSIQKRKHVAIDLFSLRHLILWPLCWPAMWLLQVLNLLSERSVTSQRSATPVQCHCPLLLSARCSH